MARALVIITLTIPHRWPFPISTAKNLGCLITYIILQVAMCGKAIGEEDVETAVDEHRDKVTLFHAS